MAANHARCLNTHVLVGLRLTIAGAERKRLIPLTPINFQLASGTRHVSLFTGSDKVADALRLNNNKPLPFL